MNLGDNLLLGLWKNLKGYVRINVCCFSKERFLNLLAANDIYAWDIIHNGRFVSLCVTVKGLKKLRPVLKKTHGRFKIVSKHGLPFYIFTHRKRSAFFIGFMLFCALLFTVSQFIWLIEINGNLSVSDADILAFMEKRGIYEGVLKQKINTDELKTNIRQNFPQISWISVVQRGTRLLVEVSENVDNADNITDTAPFDIISKYDCVITQITAQSGTPCVKVGDTVKAGDVLIRSAFDIKDENGNTAPLSPVKPSGIVRGKRHISLSAELPYLNKIKIYTGKVKTVYAFKIFKLHFDCNFLTTTPKFEYFDTVNKNIRLGTDADHPLPAVLEKTVYKEYIIKNTTLTKAQAEVLAQKILNKKIFSALPSSCAVLDKKINFIHSPDKVTAVAELFIEDDIGGNSFNGTNETSDR